MDPKKHRIIFSPSAERDIERFEADVVLQLVKDIKTYLETNPLPFGKSRIKKLTGYNPPLCRLRSGDYRAYYRIVSEEVVILAITHKKDSEKILRKLKQGRTRPRARGAPQEVHRQTSGAQAHDPSGILK